MPVFCLGGQGVRGFRPLGPITEQLSCGVISVEELGRAEEEEKQEEPVVMVDSVQRICHQSLQRKMSSQVRQ